MQFCKKPDKGNERCCARFPLDHASQTQLLPSIENPPADSASFHDRLLEVLTGIDASLKRLADAHDPAPPDHVGTPYVAQKLGVSTTWIADLIRRGEIPGNCIVPGTGNGKPWKFYRERIEKWIASR